MIDLFIKLALLISCLFALHSSVSGNGLKSAQSPSGFETKPAPDTEKSAEYKGSLWPYPQQALFSETSFNLDPQKFEFVVKETDLKQCDLLKQALDRYSKLIFPNGCALGAEVRGRDRSRGMGRDRGWGRKKSAASRSRYPNGGLGSAGELLNLTIMVRSKCEELPHLDMDEMYTLRINAPDLPNRAFLFANSVWGALRGLETFSQLIYQMDEELDGGQFYVNTTFILDYPRFSHRGILLDTSRHFVPLHSLLENLDAMAFNKLNVFHWHIVDDQSFPFESINFPNLHKKGSFEPNIHTYSPEDVAEVIEYARLRGIRVMPEFDTPGHTQSWGKGQEKLLTPCYASNGYPDGTFGPIDPTINQTYSFLTNFFQEVAKVFPDQYLHLGGDEVPFSCWQSNPLIADFMAKNKIIGYAKLEEYYMQNLVQMIEGFNKSYIVWQEVFDNGVVLKKDTVVHVWKGNGNDWEKEMASVTAGGYRALISSPWYLNYFSYPAPDWQVFYAVDPENFNGTQQQKDLVMGGEVCVWGEMVDGSNLISRTWPRASPIAERLWSPRTVTDANAAIPRMERQRCRMIQRGLRAQPTNGPGYCACDYTL